ncbi:hypothetical protein pipiens_003335 [Culex pipiens pipiens]|uniref:Uncharacterized protein n=1 Tax=Culex pipiens pipiens TaxID=38569 RepID=A0ABD1D028_CULPP
MAKAGALGSAEPLSNRVESVLTTVRVPGQAARGFVFKFLNNSDSRLRCYCYCGTHRRGLLIYWAREKLFTPYPLADQADSKPIYPFKNWKFLL